MQIVQKVFYSPTTTIQLSTQPFQLDRMDLCFYGVETRLPIRQIVLYGYVEDENRGLGCKVLYPDDLASGKVGWVSVQLFYAQPKDL